MVVEAEERIADPKRRYDLLMLSSIPVVRNGESFDTLDLWRVDLQAQVRHTGRFCLVCPVVNQAPSGWQGSARLPDGIQVVPLKSLEAESDIVALLQRFDVVQVNAGQGWRASRMARRMVAAARRAGIASIVGISSDRAKTTLLNVTVRKPAQLPAAIRALVRYVGLRAVYAQLTAAADGTFVVGAGLTNLISKRSPSVHVGTASWIEAMELETARERYNTRDADRDVRVCVAARLERMKGIHVAVDAFGLLSVDQAFPRARLSILGAGPELQNLKTQVQNAGLIDRVTFDGTLAYPDAFLRRLRTFGVVVISNLNVEQPRLIFDAISQGCIPLCPDNVVYRSLGLPTEVLYAKGDKESLTRLLAKILGRQFERQTLIEQLLAIGECFTLESMHRLRADWVASRVLQQSP